VRQLALMVRDKKDLDALYEFIMDVRDMLNENSEPNIYRAWLFYDWFKYKVIRRAPKALRKLLEEELRDMILNNHHVLLGNIVYSF